MGMFSFDEQPRYDKMTNTISELKRQIKENPIYTIIVLEKLDEDKYCGVNTGDSRVVGFYHNFKDADEVVRSNACDIYETIYNFALIEEVYPGLYPDNHNRWLYAYNPKSKEYEIMSEPIYMKNVINFSIG